MPISKQATRGFSLVELMIAVSVGTVVSLSMASLIADMSKANANMRASMDYVNFAAEVKTAMTSSSACSDAIGTGHIYTGGDDVMLDSINGNPGNAESVVYRARNGASESPNYVIQGTNLQFDDFRILKTKDVSAGSIVYLKDKDKTQKAFKKYNTKLHIAAKKYGVGATTLRPIDIPITVYAYADTNAIQLCSGNDAAAACQSMGGTYDPGDASVIPPKPENCNIVKAFGGCARGGSFSVVDNGSTQSCSAANPYTGSCNCPTNTDPNVNNGKNFSEYTTARFPATKDATFIQKECLSCDKNLSNSGVDCATNPAACAPMLDVDGAEDALDCASNPAACQACKTTPNSLKCICANDPSQPGCDDPCNPNLYGAASCECTQATMNKCAGDFSTPGCDTVPYLYQAYCLGGFNPYSPY